MDNLATTLTNIANTLNCVEVKGRDNMNRLLGCILTIDRIISELKERPEAESETEQG